MERTSKFHIYNMEHNPLCWEGKALEFDTWEGAERFMRSIDPFFDEAIMDEAVISNGILYYDGGYIDATCLVCMYANDGATFLKNVATGEIEYS